MYPCSPANPLGVLGGPYRHMWDELENDLYMDFLWVIVAVGLETREDTLGFSSDIRSKSRGLTATVDG